MVDAEDGGMSACARLPAVEWREFARDWWEEDLAMARGAVAKDVIAVMNGDQFVLDIVVGIPYSVLILFYG
jgi:hypothetical protein